MTVRRHVPWPLRLASLALAVAVGAAGRTWLWPAASARLADDAVPFDGRKAVSFEGREAVSFDSGLRIDQVAAQRREQQLRALEAENAELKADLAYLESLLPAADAQGPVAIRRFEVERDAGERGRMRYRALLMQSGRAERLFSGSLQLLVTIVDRGRTRILTLPDEGPADARERMKLAFRRLLRVEGHFSVPAGAMLKSVQLRVFERGVLRAEQRASF